MTYIEIQAYLQELKAKIKLEITLSPKQRAFYLLYASEQEVKEFLKKEKKNGKNRTKIF